MSTAERAGSEGPGSGSEMSSRSPYGYEAQGTDVVSAWSSQEMRSTRATRPPLEPKTVLRNSVKLGQRQLTVRRLDPWTILKLSVVFYTVVLLLVMLLLTLFWAFLNATGAVETVVGFASEAQLNVTYNAAQIARAIFLLGLLGIVALSGINVFFCFLYNLVADLTGGLRLTLDDDR